MLTCSLACLRTFMAACEVLPSLYEYCIYGKPSTAIEEIERDREPQAACIAWRERVRELLYVRMNVPANSRFLGRAFIITFAVHIYFLGICVRVRTYVTRTLIYLW